MATKPWHKRKLEQFTAKAKSWRRPHSTTAGPIVQTCPLAASTAPPPAPTDPCNLATLSAQLHVRRGKKEDWLPLLTNTRIGPELDATELTALKRGRARTAEQQAIVDAVKDHAIVISLARSFARDGGGQRGRERYDALNVEEELLLRGQVTSDYAAICHDLHPRLWFNTNYGKTDDRHAAAVDISTRGAHLKSLAPDVRADATYCATKHKAIVQKAALLTKALDALDGTSGLIAKTGQKVSRREGRTATARNALTEAQRKVDVARNALDALPAASVKDRARAAAKLADATTGLTDAKAIKATRDSEEAEAKTALATLRQERQNLLDLQPFAEAMVEAAAKLVAVAKRLGDVVDDAYTRVRSVAGAETTLLYDAANAAATHADVVKGQVDAILDRLEDALAEPAAAPPGGIAGRVTAAAVVTADAEAAKAQNATDVSAGEAKATELEPKVRGPAATVVPVDVAKAHEATGTDTMQPVLMKVRPSDMGINWIRDHVLVHPRNWLNLSSTRREMIVEAQSCGYSTDAAATALPKLTALIHLQGLDNVVAEFEYRGLQWGVSRGIRHEIGEARKAGDPDGSKERVDRTTRLEGDTYTLGLERKSTETSTATGYQGGTAGHRGSRSVEVTTTKIKHYDSKGEDISPDDKESASTWTTDDDRALAFTDPYTRDPAGKIVMQGNSAGAAKAVDDITAFNSNVGRALYSGLFRAQIVVNGVGMDTGAIADILASLQEIVEVVRFIIDLVSGTAKSGAQLAFPFQVEAGVRAEITVLGVSIAGRRWADVDPEETIITKRCYIEHAVSRFELRFDITVFDGKLTLYFGVALVLGHPKILRAGLNLEVAVGGKLRIFIPLVRDTDSTRVFGVQNTLLASMGAVLGANAGPIFVEIKGEIEGSLDFFWDFMYHSTPARHFECTRADIVSNGIAPKFSVNVGSKIKIPFFPGGGVNLFHWQYPPEERPYYFVNPSTPDKPLYSWKKDAKKSKAREQAEKRRDAQAPNKAEQTAAAQRAAEARRKRT